MSARRVGRWLPPLLYMGLVFYLSSQSNPAPELTERVWDKALHLVEYGGLGMLFYRAFLGEEIGAAAAALCAVVATSLYGASDEWHQLFTPGRNSDIHDWFADTIGAAVGIAAYAAAVLAARRVSARSLCLLQRRGTDGPAR
jgi:VanZ family protein